MRALFLVRDVPYPATNGYRKRNYFLIMALKKMGHELALLFDCAPVTVPDALSQCCETIRFCKTNDSSSRKGAVVRSLFSRLPFSVLLRTSQETRQAVVQFVESHPVDVVICDSIYRASNIPFGGRTHSVLCEHNVESVIIRRYCEAEKNPLKKLAAASEYVKLARFEKRTWKRFSGVIACSELERCVIESRSGHRNVVVVDNGVETGYFDSAPYQQDECTLVYTGQIGWHPNEDALIHFVDEIFPRIKEQVPAVKFLIVGEKPSPRIRMLAARDASIQITGFVEDVRAYMARATVFVVPLRIGSGTRLKILEAMSMKRAIVSTSVGCEGLAVQDGKHLLVRDTPAQFAAATIDLLRNESARASLGEQGRRLAEQRYDWSRVFGELDAVLARKSA